jgi:rubrerythrin
VEDVIAEIDE